VKGFKTSCGQDQLPVIFHVSDIFTISGQGLQMQHDCSEYPGSRKTDQPYPGQNYFSKNKQTRPVIAS
jgi:hypothetical protein